MNEDKYLFRRQFVLGPENLSGFSNWKRLQIEDGLHLMVHPDLQVSVATHGTSAIYLLGYMLDPNNPVWSNEKIVSNIVCKIKSIDEIYDYLSRICGRFVLIIRIGLEMIILHDPGGMRQIYYYLDSDKRYWFASQPTLLANHFNISVDSSIMDDFKNTALFAMGADYWFPGAVTLYSGVKRLMPNHYFDLRHHKIIRYWPKKPIKKLSVSKCVEDCSILLKGIISSANRRFNLCLGISAGMDSRLLLAASREVAKDIQFFTQKSQLNDNENLEVSIPKKVTQALGLKHEVISIPENLPLDFKNMLERNVMASKEYKGLNAYSIERELIMQSDKDFGVMYGNLSEITKRDRYRFPIIPKFILNAELLTEMAHMTGSRIALEEFSGWFDSVKEFNRYNINILDLMHWEHRVGSWAAMTFSHYDIAFETICPYNCREYIEAMLGVPFRYRTMPDYILHRAIIKNLWPEVLQEDILTVNREKVKWRNTTLDLLYRTKVYDFLKYFYIMYYKRLQ